MKFTVRSAVMEDFDKLLPIQQEVAQIHHGVRPDVFRNDVRVLPAEFEANIHDPEHLCLVAELPDGSIAGFAFAWVVHCRNHPVNWDYDSFYIDDICVLAKYRRMGIGKALMDGCVKAARLHKCVDIQLGVWSFNKDALAFYESFGMTPRNVRMEMKLPFTTHKEGQNESGY